MDAGIEASEVVTRPPPGIARGAWEAPVWFFWGALAVGLVAAGLYAWRRMRQAPGGGPR